MTSLADEIAELMLETLRVAAEQEEEKRLRAEDERRERRRRKPRGAA
jgi:hypothetical protein